VAANAILAVALVAAVCTVLLAGYPVALTLAGISLMFAAGGAAAGVFDPALLGALPERLPFRSSFSWG